MARNIHYCGRTQVINILDINAVLRLFYGRSIENLWGISLQVDAGNLSIGLHASCRQNLYKMYTLFF